VEAKFPMAIDQNAKDKLGELIDVLDENEDVISIITNVS